MADLKPPLSGYSLWFETSGNDAESLQSLIDTLATQYGAKSFTAHTTLIALLDKTEADLPLIQQACETFSAQSAFTCEIIGIGNRDAYLQSVFLPMSPSPEMALLNQQARNLLQHENDPIYMPHWSMVYGDFDRETKKTMNEYLLQQFSFPKKVTIDSITLMSSSGYPDDWHTVQRYPLSV